MSIDSCITMNDNLPEAIQKLKALELPPKVFLNQLTPLEKSVLNVLIVEEQALTVNAIRNRFIDEIWTTAVTTNPTTRKKLKIEAPPYTPECWTGGVEAYHIDGKKLYDTVMQHIKNRTPPQKRFNESKKVIRELNIASPPDQKTIHSILVELEAMGVVVSREEIGRKGKKAYYVNPAFLKELEES